MATMAPAAGYREVRAVGSQEPFDHCRAAVGMDDEAGAIGVMEHPGPPVLLSDPMLVSSDCRMMFAFELRTGFP